MSKYFSLSSDIEKGDNPMQRILHIGKVTFSTTDSQATFRTKLLQIDFGAGNLAGAVSPATDFTGGNVVSVPTGAVSGGAITITRSSGGTSGASYNILLIGSKYTAAP